MRKVVMLTLLGLVALTILVESRMLEALAIFFLAGIIPGTNITVPYGVMLLLFIELRFFAQEMRLAVDLDADEAFSLHAFKNRSVFAFAATDKGCEEMNFRSFGKFQ